jgi:phosphoribosylanthranilate isomerase
VTLVKICGVRRAEDVAAAVEAGADMVGLVFWPGSRRCVTQEAALAALRAAPRGLLGRVGLFVNQPADEIAALAAACGLDCVQLSGDETAAECRAVRTATGLPVIKSIRAATGEGGQAGLDALLLAEGERYPDDAAPLLLVDAPAAGAWGGSGQPWPYAAAAALAAQRRILLAGGLSPERVALAIRQARPWAVDVSSGVETNGAKDPAKIAAFVRAARAAEA